MTDLYKKVRAGYTKFFDNIDSRSESTFLFECAVTFVFVIIFGYFGFVA